MSIDSRFPMACHLLKKKKSVLYPSNCLCYPVKDYFLISVALFLNSSVFLTVVIMVPLSWLLYTLCHHFDYYKTIQWPCHCHDYYACHGMQTMHRTTMWHMEIYFSTQGSRERLRSLSKTTQVIGIKLGLRSPFSDLRSPNDSQSGFSFPPSPPALRI